METINRNTFISTSHRDLVKDPTEEIIIGTITKFITDKIQRDDINNIINDTIYISFSPVIKHKEITNTIASFLSIDAINNFIKRYYNNIIIQNIDNAISLAINNYHNITYRSINCCSKIQEYIFQYMMIHKVSLDAHKAHEANATVSEYIGNKVNIQVKDRLKHILSQDVKTYLENTNLIHDTYKNDLNGIRYIDNSINVYFYFKTDEDDDILQILNICIKYLIRSKFYKKHDYIYEAIDFYRDELTDIIDKHLL
jgi:hypothetical protein